MIILSKSYITNFGGLKFIQKLIKKRLVTNPGYMTSSSLNTVDLSRCSGFTKFSTSGWYVNSRE
jgi:hypothetical protein